MEQEPTTNEPNDQGVTKPLAPTPFRRWRKTIAAGAVGLGVGALLVTGALAAPSATPSAGSGTPTTQGPTRGANGTPAAGRQGGQAGQGMPGGGPAGGQRGGMIGGPGGGKVTAISGSTITVQAGGPAANGATNTVTVNGSTAYLVEGAGKVAFGALSDIKVGNTIRTVGTADSSGNVTALLVSIAAPQADGEVTAVSGNTITIQGRGPANGGATQTVTVGSGTQYVTGDPQSSTASSLGAVTVGTHIYAEGTLNADGSLVATLVRIEQARTAPSAAPSAAPSSAPRSGTPTAGGKGMPGGQGGPGRSGQGPKGDGTVTAISGNAITVQAGGPNASGATSTVTVTSGTVYLIGGPDQLKKGSLSDVQAGMRIHVEGNTDERGNVTALVVRAETAPTTTR